MYIGSVKEMIGRSMIGMFVHGLPMFLFIMIMCGSFKMGCMAGCVYGIMTSGILLIVSLCQHLSLKNKDISFLKEKKVIARGLANHRIGKGSSGGCLFLTENALIFKAHNLNYSVHEIEIPLDKIIKIEKDTEHRFFKTGILVITENQKECFYVNSRKKWIEIIEKYRNLQVNSNEDFNYMNINKQ